MKQIRVENQLDFLQQISNYIKSYYNCLDIDASKYVGPGIYFIKVEWTYNSYGLNESTLQTQFITIKDLIYEKTCEIGEHHKFINKLLDEIKELENVV